jgi:steroid 5-alpha reductase family enzyme
MSLDARRSSTRPVGVIMLPISYLLDRGGAPGLGAWAITGATVWLTGLLIEAAADA